jgi:hypothetical protein
VATLATFRLTPATAKTLKSSGGDGTITLASLANGSYRQSTKIDFGASWSQVWIVELEIELAATPTDGNLIDVWCNPSSSSTAATDNKGGCSGSDAAYSGYSSNASASVNHLSPVGSHRCTAQATTTVQKSVLRERWTPPNRYCSFVLLNGAGSAVHSSDTNCLLRFTPLEPIAEG